MNYVFGSHKKIRELIFSHLCEARISKTGDKLNHYTIDEKYEKSVNLIGTVVRDSYFRVIFDLNNKNDRSDEIFPTHR